MIRKNIISKYYILIFILFIFLFIVEGFFCNYDLSKFKKTYNFCEINFFKSFWHENGIVENIQSLFLFFSICFLIKARSFYKNIKIINYFLLIKIFALIYYLGEEISWGQHFFKWNTPEIFNELNNQNETNFHNISNLLDQVPRSLVILWCGFIPLVFYFFRKKFRLSNKLNLIILPNLKLLVVSLILLLFFLPDLLVDKMNLHPGHHVDGKDVVEAKYYDILTFNFVERLSEIQELIFCFYFFIYSIALSNFRGNNEII